MQSNTKILLIEIGWGWGVPEGQDENSPAFQRRGRAGRECLVPEGRYAYSSAERDAAKVGEISNLASETWRFGSLNALGESHIAQARLKISPTLRPLGRANRTHAPTRSYSSLSGNSTSTAARRTTASGPSTSSRFQPVGTRCSMMTRWVSCSMST